MLRFRFSTRALFLGSVIVAIYFPVRSVYEPWRRERLQTSHEMYSDYETSSQIYEGNSVQTVTRHFPTLKIVDETPTWDNLSMQYPNVKPTDEFYRCSYRAPGAFGYFHFRDGRLVSHPRDRYKDPIANAIRAGNITSVNSDLIILSRRFLPWPDSRVQRCWTQSWINIRV
jgi:hypothetical protein